MGEFCSPLDTLTMTLANLLSTQKACVTDPILRRLEASSEPAGRRLQSLVVTDTEAEFNSHVVTDECPDIDSCIGSVALGAFGSDSASSVPNAFEIYLRSLNNMYDTVTSSIDIITTTTTTTTSLATTTGWRWSSVVGVVLSVARSVLSHLLCGHPRPQGALYRGSEAVDEFTTDGHRDDSNGNRDDSHGYSYDSHGDRDNYNCSDGGPRRVPTGEDVLIRTPRVAQNSRVDGTYRCQRHRRCSK